MTGEERVDGSGLEPLPALRVRRSVRLVPHALETFRLDSHALARFRAVSGPQAALPPCLADAARVSPDDQLSMQAALQQHVDSAIAKTLTVAEGCSAAELDRLLRRAHALGLKGCTVYRPGTAAGAVLTPLDGRANEPVT